MVKEINKTEQIAYKILIEPWITEAATLAAEKNQYIFKVAPRASKPQIKKVIEDIYKVTVLSVRTVNIHAKKRIRGNVVGKKTGYRKAIITLKEGGSINVFEGK